MEKIFGLSKIRSKKIAIKVLIKIIRNIFIALLICISATAIIFAAVNSNLLKTTQNNEEDIKKTVITYKNNETSKNANVCLLFNSTIHTDYWEIYLNNELLDTFVSQNGVQALLEKKVVLNETESQNIILKSSSGKELNFNINDIFTGENEINIEIGGDYKPVEIELQLQNPELPNGCEATSLAMLLSSAGLKTDKIDAAKAIPTENFSQDEQGRLCAPNPEQFYAGRPESKTRGFYAFVPPVQQAANDLFNAAQISLQAKDISGSEFEDIDLLLKNGSPVMLWITIDYGALRYCKNFSWIQTDTKESYIPVANLHCVIAKYSNEAYTVFDPIQGEIQIGYQKLKYVYEQMGKRALYVE